MYPLILHKTMTVERWNQFPAHQRILMIGNEIQRLKDFMQMNSRENIIVETFERAMELTDLTIETTSGNFRKELLRWREMLSLAYHEKEQHKDNSEFIEQLFQTLMFFTPQSALAY